MSELDIEVTDMMDLLEFTFSDDFLKKWKYKYSTKFIRHFQLKLLSSINNKKQLKKTVLYRYLTNKYKYSNAQVDNFFDSIEIELYYPLIY